MTCFTPKRLTAPFSLIAAIAVLIGCAAATPIASAAGYGADIVVNGNTATGTATFSVNDIERYANKDGVAYVYVRVDGTLVSATTPQGSTRAAAAAESDTATFSDGVYYADGTDNDDNATRDASAVSPAAVRTVSVHTVSVHTVADVNAAAYFYAGQVTKESNSVTFVFNLTQKAITQGGELKYDAFLSPVRIDNGGRALTASQLATLRASGMSGVLYSASADLPATGEGGAEDASATGTNGASGRSTLSRTGTVMLPYCIALAVIALAAGAVFAVRRRVRR
ncbi:hypothetical protein [Bifidobacterium catulorum]|uniref:Cell surface protein n=1 Tax=Bifidobacterium catulorum TaxID=1630173 RepID=A0A2U2MT24_9BIFI|nr:hypothetical protein [Bifidobacterium catulorum]PWG59982.1 hypothetical protein DF200_04905 [Bifidobacterium catulorum]